MSYTSYTKTAAHINMSFELRVYLEHMITRIEKKTINENVYDMHERIMITVSYF